MQSTAQDQYLATEVKTAPPQRLHLLLIEAALRLANRARQYWDQGHNDLALGALLHAQSMIAEMLASMDRDAGGGVALRISAEYSFIYRSLVQAGHRRDEKGLADAIRVLEIERETWRKLCDKLAADAGREGLGDPPSALLPPHFANLDPQSQSGGFSIEA